MTNFEYEQNIEACQTNYMFQHQGIEELIKFEVLKNE